MIQKFDKKEFASEEGAAIVEYALVLPIFFLLTFGIIEMSMIFWVESTLEFAVQSAARYARTGDTSGGGQLATAQSLVDEYTFGFLDTSKIKLTVTPYTTFDDIPDTLPTGGGTAFGVAGQPVVYTLSYDWPFFTGIVGQAFGGNGTTITLKGSEIVMSEPLEE